MSFQPPPNEKEILLDEIKRAISEYMVIKYPDFNGRLSEMIKDTENRQKEIIRMEREVKSSVEKIFITHTDEFKKEISQFLSKDHPVFNEIERMRTQLKETSAEYQATNQRIKSILDHLEESHIKLQSRTEILSRNTSILEDIYEIKDELKYVRSMFENFRDGLKLIFQEQKPHNLEMPIEEIELSIRTSNALANAGIKTLRDLIVFPENGLRRLRNFGNKCLEEVRNAKKKLGLR